MGKFPFKKLKTGSFPTLCLVCGVDSTPILVFLGVVIGGTVLSTILIMVWATVTNRVDFKEDKAFAPLEAEKKEG